ncbi:MAG TPA: helix-turn-helix transcriptional regulator [Leptolyngbyaceae cyanobacterium]
MKCDTSTVDRSTTNTHNRHMNESREKILRTLGQLVKQQRTALGISQEELGLRANLDRTYISGVERGVRNPSVTALVSLASGLGITVSDLLENLEIETDKIE